MLRTSQIVPCSWRLLLSQQIQALEKYLQEVARLAADIPQRLHDPSTNELLSKRRL